MKAEILELLKDSPARKILEREFWGYELYPNLNRSKSFILCWLLLRESIEKEQLFSALLEQHPLVDRRGFDLAWEQVENRLGELVSNAAT